MKSQVSDNMTVTNFLNLSSKVTLHCSLCDNWSLVNISPLPMDVMLSSVTRGHWRDTEGEMDFSSKWLLLSPNSCSTVSPALGSYRMSYPVPSSSSATLQSCRYGFSRAQTQKLPLSPSWIALQQSTTCLASPGEWLSIIPQDASGA